MAGMPAARVLADHFDQVVVLENDTLPSEALLRTGTPQAKHAHVLIAGGQQALSALFPGFEQSLAAAGAVQVRVSTDSYWERPGFAPFPQRDLGIAVYSMTRPLLESVVRKHFAAIPNIKTHQRCRAQQLITTEDGARVTGVSCTHSDGTIEEIPSGLVIDASSNGQLTLNLLAALDLPAPEESAVGIEMGYATTFFEIPQDAPSNWKLAYTLADPPANRRGALLIPVEGNCWMVSLAGSHDSKPPDDDAGFLEYARQIRTRTIYSAIKGATRRGPISRYVLKASRWRHFENLEKLPDGLIPFGDTICRFNPIYGQGMTVAAKEACLLLDLLKTAAGNGNGIGSVPAEFLAKSQPIIDAPWATAVVPDFLDPLTKGDRPADLDDALRFTQAVIKLAYKDPAMHKLMVEVQYLLKPRSVLREPEVFERIKAKMAQTQEMSELAG